MTETNSLLVKGLPPAVNRAFILGLTESNRLARGKDDRELITIYTAKPGEKFVSARVTFTTIENARAFRDRWNKEAPAGTANRLKIDFYVDRRQPAGAGPAPTEPTRPSNSLLIQGLPSGLSKEQLVRFAGADIVRGKSGQPLVQIFPPRDGYCSARIVLKSVDAATQFVEMHNKKTFNGNANLLSVKYYKDRNAVGPQVDEATLNSIRAAVAESSQSVMVKGLPENCNEDYLIAISKQQIMMGNKGKRLVHVFPGCGSAKITFPTPEAARAFVADWHKKAPPGYSNKLTVQFYLEKNEAKSLASPLVLDKHSDKARTAVRNVVYIQGLSKTVDNKELVQLVDLNCGQKPSKTKIYRYPDGKSEGRGTVSFREAAQAKACIDQMNGKRIGGSTVCLKLSLFESTKIRRLPGAIGNEHLYTNGTIGYAYDCLACFDTWDERDMIGCVPIGHNNTDLNTHFLCQECVRSQCKADQIDGRLGEGGSGLPCGQTGCSRVLLRNPVLRILLDRDTAGRLERRMDKACLDEIPGLEYCKEDCGFAAFVEQDPRLMQFFSCQTPSCMSQFCRICQISFAEHMGKTCDEVDPRRQVEKKLKIKVEAALNILADSKIRICPKCGLRFTKENDGTCNKMRCSCGTTMCYLCKTPNIDYTHFGRQCKLSTNTTEADRLLLDQAIRLAERDENLREAIELLRQQKII